MVSDQFLESGRELLALLVSQSGILEKGHGSRSGSENSARGIGEFLLTDIGVVELPLDEELPQWLVLTGYLQIQVGLDGFYLCVTHHAPMLDIVDE